jgi:hypothetical protein
MGVNRINGVDLKYIFQIGWFAMKTYFTFEFKLLACSMCVFFFLAIIGCALENKYAHPKPLFWLAGFAPNVEAEVIVPGIDSGPWEA